MSVTLPWDLTVNDVEALNRLIRSTDWPVYSALVQRRFADIAEGFMECPDFAAHQKIVGALKAYEEMLGLPDLVIAKLEEVRDRTASTAESAERADRESRAHRYGSRLWNAPPSDGAGLEGP